MMLKGAELSPCRRFRYALWRIWDGSKPTVMFIGLNPSTADEKTDDPTLIRCINFAKAWGYGGVYTANLFAYRATDPKQLLKRKRVVGKDNDQWLSELAKKNKLIIAAWGNDGKYQNRSQQVKQQIQPLHYLKMNKSGEPAHPLYLKADLTPIPFESA